MTEPRITDAYIAEQLALAEKATPGPWICFAYMSGPAHSMTVWQAELPPGHGPKAGGQVEITDAESHFVAAARAGYPAVLRALAEALAQVKVLREALVKAEEDMIWMFGAWDGSSADEEPARPPAHANIAALHAALAAAPVEEVKDA